METKKFLAWCADIFNEPVEELSLATLRDDLEGWDSMGALLLLADLDEIHDIQLGEGELNKLETLGDIAKLIDACAD